MKYLFLISLTLTTCVNATIPVLAPRQSLCDAGEKVCANGCIPSSYSCCVPAAAGGCEPGTVCYVGNDGVPGCCPVGKDCQGEAGLDGKSFDEPTATADEPANITEESSYTDDRASGQFTDNRAPDEFADYGNAESTGVYGASACNLIDGTVSYLMVGAMALLL